jgi:hypothetical protein
MTATNGKLRTELIVSTAKAAAAERIAAAIVAGFEVCAQAGVPLSQLQKIALVEAALLEFDGFEAHVGSVAAIDELLRRNAAN